MSAQPQSTLEMIGSMLPLFLVMGVTLYMFSIRPALKRQKEMDQLQKSLQKGDRVLTQAGFIAEIHALNDSGTVTLRLAENVKVEFQRQAILSKVQDN